MICRNAPCLLLAAMTVSASACQRHEFIMSPADAAFGVDLEGLWDITYSISQPPVLTTDARRLRSINGRIALILNESITADYPEIPTVTDYGSYDVDFSTFGFASPQWGRPSTVVAGRLGKDSVMLLLSPGAGATSVRMSGALHGDSINGTWSVSLTRTSGGGGQFTMKRRR